MAGRIEKTYGKLFKYALIAMNPFKKVIIRTECQIHVFINFKALDILKNDGFWDAHTFFSDYIAQLNAGVVWADQDFKSSGHFYHPIKKRGLYGSKDALTLGVDYYNKAIGYWRLGDVEKSMFFLGAAVHIVQDMTVPQHASIRLLDNHRQYENFIKRTYLNSPRFVARRGGYYLGSVREFIRCNARNAMRIYGKLHRIDRDEKRYYTITKFTLPLAQKTTAGCLMLFYRDVAGKDLRERNPVIKRPGGF